MKYWLLLIILVSNSCVTVDENFEGRPKPISFSICFWNAEKLDSKKVKIWTGKKSIISVLAANCDNLAFTNIKTDQESLSDDLETLFLKESLNYSCEDSINRIGDNDEVLNETKYINCANHKKVIEMKLVDYPDSKSFLGRFTLGGNSKANSVFTDY